MKSLFLLIYIYVFFYSASSQGFDACENPNASRVAGWALDDLKSVIMPGEEALERAVKDSSCQKNWFERIFENFNVSEGGFYGGCGLSIPFQDEKSMLEFAEKLKDANKSLDYVEVADIFAWISVPICGHVESQ